MKKLTSKSMAMGVAAILSLATGASAASALTQGGSVAHTGSNKAWITFSAKRAQSEATQGTSTYRQGAQALCRRANGGQMWYNAGNVKGVNQGMSTYDCGNNGTYNVALDNNYAYQSAA